MTLLVRYLGVVDLIGTMYEDNVVATGFGNYVCLPLLRKAGTDLSKEDAKKVLEDCMRVLFYRNCKSSTKVIFAFRFESFLQTSDHFSQSDPNCICISGGS